MRNPRRVFSSEHVMELIWGYDAEAEIDVIWTYISLSAQEAQADRREH